ncbi:RNA-directed DNA polymerase [Sesamum angolense]|uniref:RNA-directed DNA polymerase n=1 Tax=Sesamum angolense TaxID=2727404 RepID=A0AAE1X1B0_9LAMI|nr:RNA-directed DNA polymerase [Sesamum angolense]
MADQTLLRNHVAELESQKAVGEWPDMLDKRVTSATEEASILTDAVDVRVDGVQAEVKFLKRVVGQDEDCAPMSKAARIPEAEKVSITSMYLTGDAKLWWRTRLSDDASANWDKIETWDVLKKELKDQFFTLHTSWLARESLRKLKHVGTVRDYVKEFSSLMLDLWDMSEEDKLFNFLSGLQAWAQTELRCQGVKDLSSVIAAADRLVDFWVANSSDLEKKKKDSGKEKGKFGKGWKDGKFKKKKHQERGKLNALVAEPDDDEGGSTRVNPLQFVSALQEQPAKQKGLMYVGVQINGKAVIAMLDSGASHKFVADREIQKLGLTLAQHSNRIKEVNSEAKPIQGVACGELKDFVRSAKKKDSLISAMQVKAGLRYGEQTYLAALIETPYRMAPAELAKLRKQLDGLLEARLVQPSKAPYDLFDKLTKAKYYTKIDLRSRYWQVRVARDDEPKTTCVTRRFIKGYSKIVNPLKDLLRKDQKWEWTFACDDAFRSLKQAISSQPVLKLPQFDKPFEVQVDASDWALGAEAIPKTGSLVLSGLVRKYWLDSGLLYAKGGRVFVPTGTLRRRLLRETHDPQWAGHPGINRMVALLARQYYWPRMEDVEAYVMTCLVCQLDKVERKKEARLLQPLSIPEVLWQSISMDFISGFLKVNGMASVLVVVDRFSKYGIFIVVPHACPAETTVELFFKNGTKYFGVPKDIVSDRDARFTERQQPTTPHEISVQKKSGKCLAANRFARSKQELLDKAKDNLAKAQCRMKKYADMGRRHVEFSGGDQDLLDMARQQTQHALPVIRKEFEKTMLKTDGLLGSLVGEGRCDTTDKGVKFFWWRWFVTPFGWCPALVWQACASRRGTMHAGHNGRTGLADARAELDSMAQHSVVVCAGRHAAHSRRTGLRLRKRASSLSPKQAHWQEFWGEFNFEWVHRPGKHNDVADALSQKLVEEYVAALTVVESDFFDQIQESSKTDAGYLNLVEQIQSGLIRKYWLDSGLLMPKMDGCLCQWGRCAPFVEGDLVIQLVGWAIGF